MPGLPGLEPDVLGDRGLSVARPIDLMGLRHQKGPARRAISLGWDFKGVDRNGYA